MTWHGWGLTDIGRVRKINQDAFQLHPDHSMWIVADGMGGHAGGEVASQLAIETIGSYVQQHQTTNHTSHTDNREVILRGALDAANRAVRNHAREHTQYSGMGTTAVILSISSKSTSQATIAHIGDSRAYLIQEHGISQLMRDHTLVEERIELGLLTREEAATHPLRNVLTRGLGIESEVEASIQSHTIQITDKILLCSDGLTKMMNDDEIFNVIRQYNHSLKEACQQLVDTANQLGGEDNVTVVLVGAET
ncbi:MAG: Stp1/IreP family PP2C-type Ser/Thr phosphatase [Nitrospirales bacterium]